MAIDLQQQNRVINHHHHSMSHQNTSALETDPFKSKKKKNRFGGQTERGQCADVSSVKDEAVLRCCCCCWDQDLCYCCYCQPERGYL